MKVLLKVTMAGPNFFHRDGDIIDVTEQEGASLIAAGYAEEVQGPPVVAGTIERATDPKAETAERRPGPKAKRK